MFPKIILSKREKDAIARMLAISPQTLEQFEKAYRETSLDGIFGPSAKEVVRETRNYTEEELKDILKQSEVKSLCDQICDNIIWRYHSLPWDESPDEKSKIKQLPTHLRPQLTASCMTRDIPDDMPSEMLLTQLALFMRETNPDKRSMYYGCFRQGLDILDLDPIMYEMLGRNPNSIGNWFPALQEAASKQAFFKIPETKIMRVPLQILQMSRLQYESLTLATKYIVNRFVVNEFGLDPAKKYFIKTGVFSCKFDFRNCVISGQEVTEAGEYLLYISSLAAWMAGPLGGSFYGANTTNEWIVREYIEDVENNPTIYHGLPLRTEYRVFIDCDTDEVLGISPYWRPDVMKKRFEEESDRNTPDMVHDYIVYCAHEPVLMRRYEENKEKVLAAVENMLPSINLKGQWSLDVMQNGDDFYLIDMALANTSALRDVVPAGKLIEAAEDCSWCLPQRIEAE